MSGRHDEISRFSNGRKTFFFNKGHAKNDTEYLAVNAIWGQGNREQVVIFPNQMLEFYKHYLDALEELTGLRPGDSEIEDSRCGEIPSNCPDCGDTDAAYAVEVLGDEWRIVCSNCRELIFHNRDKING